ncbi:carboxypeptidase-like regulatory domain-containing protein [Sunxiuqinia sp. A32]|uniref:carboxypeptidase-like regulatory domain-containing protein n=1 Tax=Sunxiuqinia sp. A32 TaxID=3461496 RepID=UPI004045B63C
MPKFLYLIRMLVLCFPIYCTAQNEPTSILDKELSITTNDQPLVKILDKISSETRLYFSYDPVAINVKELVSVHYENWTVNAILIDLFRGKYDFQVLQNQVIITRLRAGTVSVSSVDTVKVEQFVKLSGHVRDELEKQSIPYASVSILGRSFGTITNIDGDFEIKIPSSLKNDTLCISCMGYAQEYLKIDTLTTNILEIDLKPIDIRLSEIKVTAVKALDLIDKLLDNRKNNYPGDPYLMTAFYREVLLQDGEYMNVSEAVMKILKASYLNSFREDRIKFLKGRKSPDVSPFKYVEFKMQGGPYYITKLDVIKTMDTFLDEAYRNMYDYRTDELIEYLGRPTYVISFKPHGKMDFLSYEGKLFIDRESYALVHAEFELGNDGLKSARRSLIRKKPKDFKVRPIDLKYQVTYKMSDGKWQLNTAQTSVKFKVRSKKDKINSIFHSVSDLLITQNEVTELRRFNHDETINSTDIFTEMIIDYDEEFWGQFNTIKPNENLRNAISSNKSGKESESNQLHNSKDYITKNP